MLQCGASGGTDLMDRPGSEEAGNPWARWEYTPEEWQVFDHRDWDGAVRMFVRSILERYCLESLA